MVLLAWGVDSHKVVVDLGLDACLGAGGVVSVSVKASSGGVELNDVLQLGFTSFKSFLPEVTLGFALLKQQRLGVLAFLNHCLDISRLGDVRGQSWLMSHPSRC